MRIHGPKTLMKWFLLSTIITPWVGCIITTFKSYTDKFTQQWARTLFQGNIEPCVDILKRWIGGENGARQVYHMCWYKWNLRKTIRTKFNCVLISMYISVTKYGVYLWERNLHAVRYGTLEVRSKWNGRSYAAYVSDPTWRMIARSNVYLTYKVSICNRIFNMMKAQ